MFRILFVGLFGCMLWALLPVAAHAETAIFFSEPDSYWGWCTRDRPNQVTACAQQNCQGGGTACRPVAFCAGGWNAIAQPEDPALGVAVACALDSDYSARAQALGNCLVLTNALCWTSSAFDGNGNEVAQGDREAFDLIWYAQGLLQLKGYKVDGVSGVVDAQTTAAIAQFQADHGMPITAVADRAVIDRLIEALGGLWRLVKGVKEGVVDPSAANLAGHLYTASLRPNTAMNFGQAMLAATDDERRARLATFLTGQGSPCTSPAERATQMFDDGFSWDIACAEGGYTLIVMEDGGTFIQTDQK